MDLEIIDEGVVRWPGAPQGLLLVDRVPRFFLGGPAHGAARNQRPAAGG